MKLDSRQPRLVRAWEAGPADRDLGGCAAKAAFTLIELLVVMFVLAILVALMVGVGTWIRRSGQEKQTLATQKIVMAAIQAFYDVRGEYPADGGDGDESDDSGEALLKSLKAEDEEKTRRATMKILRGLPQAALSAGDKAVKDGFGKEMRYDEDGGLGGRPVVISAGPDRNFNEKDDDIRSDRQ